MHTNKNIQKKYGFTLAEVLVTLAIIGVVAALTIPSLIMKVQKQQYETGYKKAYSTLTQAVSGIMLDNGDKMSWTWNGTNTYANVFGTKINFVKICPKNTMPGECFPVNVSLLQGTPQVWSSNSLDRVVLNNGSSMMFETYDWACGHVIYSSGGVNQGCGYIYVDVNGLKAPNTYGRDIFQFVLAKYGIYPSGAPGTSSAVVLDRCDTASLNNWNGQNCGARIMKEGGAMTY